MSLLLDALKEAGTHRKRATQDVEEKLELSEDEFELELNLDEQPINTNNENAREISRDLPGIADANKDDERDSESLFGDEIKDRGQHAWVEPASTEGSKHNNAMLQNEKSANAVFRNRSGNKNKPSKLVIAVSMLLLLVVIVAAYFYWTLTNIDSVNQSAPIATRDSGAEVQVPMEETEIGSAVKNPAFTASFKTESGVREVTLAGGDKYSEKSNDDNVEAISQESDQMQGYPSNTGQQDVNENQQEQLASTNGTYKNGGEITIRKRHMPNTTRKNLRVAQKAMVVGDWHKAERNFRKVLVDSPGNVEALIGLADAMVVLGKEDIAQSLYLNVLEKNPVNVRASVGLLNLKADKTSVNHGSALKQLITENPDQAYLHANLGDYYARRGEWAAAQNAYFDAFSYNGMNADYAFNLAVSLDQIGKGSIAIRYYKQALELKQSTAGRFDENSLVIRIRELSGGGQ